MPLCMVIASVPKIITGGTCIWGDYFLLCRTGQHVCIDLYSQGLNVCLTEQTGIAGELGVEILRSFGLAVLIGKMFGGIHIL